MPAAVVQFSLATGPIPSNWRRWANPEGRQPAEQSSLRCVRCCGGHDWAADKGGATAATEAQKYAIEVHRRMARGLRTDWVDTIAFTTSANCSNRLLIMVVSAFSDVGTWVHVRKYLSSRAAVPRGHTHKPRRHG